MFDVCCMYSSMHACYDVGGSSTSHPSWTRIGWRIACLPNMRVVASAWSLLLQYVNSDILAIIFGLGTSGGWVVGGWPGGIYYA